MEQQNQNSEAQSASPVEVIAQVSRVVTKVVDRITGDRNDYPLMVAAACVEGLKGFGIEARVMYGQAAWIEILEDESLIWAGCWGDNLHFWVATQFGEVVDLNTSVAHRRRGHDTSMPNPILSPPMVWAREVPRFYRYVPEGIAELELTDEQDQERYSKVLREVHEKCRPDAIIPGASPEFPNEPILCSGRRLLDDSNQSFKKFDRYLGVKGIPQSPF
jgi:hypothetical protein